MQRGSVVEYIGGNDAVGQTMYSLQKDTEYIVDHITVSRFADGIKMAVALAGIPRFLFYAGMFRELRPPIGEQQEDCLPELAICEGQ